MWILLTPLFIGEAPCASPLMNRILLYRTRARARNRNRSRKKLKDLGFFDYEPRSAEHEHDSGTFSFSPTLTNRASPVATKRRSPLRSPSHSGTGRGARGISILVGEDSDRALWLVYSEPWTETNPNTITTFFQRPKRLQ